MAQAMKPQRLIITVKLNAVQNARFFTVCLNRKCCCYVWHW